MKGLILKDLYALKGYAKQYVFVLGFMILWAVMMGNASFVVMYMILMGSMLVLSAMSMDEAVSFNRFALTTPVSAGRLVGAKYLLLLITMGIGALVSFLINLLMPLFKGDVEGIGWGAMFVTIAIYLIVSAFTFPAVFKLGVDKGRYVFIVVAMIFAVVIMAGGKSLDFVKTLFDMAEQTPEGILAAVSVGISAVFLAISYEVSVGIANKKEW